MKISEEFVKTRLDVFVSSHLGITRSSAQGLIDGGNVTVNGRAESKNYKLRLGDEIEIEELEPKELDVCAENIPLDIIYEDEDFIAVDKPAGLLSVESDNETECAFSHVFAYLQETSKTSRPYILHRIDKETSGVLVFAKNPKVYSALKLHWNECVTLREYHAVAEGVFENKQDTITSYLKENVNNLVYVTQDRTAQKAVTQYKVIKENAQYSLLRVQIETGKKNLPRF